jgi:hypothetical protein
VLLVLINNHVSTDNQFAYGLEHLQKEITPGCTTTVTFLGLKLQKRATCNLVPVQTYLQTGMLASTPHGYLSIAAVSSVCFAKNVNLAIVNLLEGGR